MKAKRFVILGFDGLEYNLVERFNLTSLKQEQYGKVMIPKECFIKVDSPHFASSHFEPWTPLVWYSFLTGKLPSSKFLRDVKIGGKWNNNLLNAIEDLSFTLGLGNLRRISARAIEILRILGFQKKLPVIQDYRVPTLFDHIDKTIDIDVPIYSKNWHFGLSERTDENFIDFINRSLKVELDRFDEKKKVVLDILKTDGNWTLLMMYTKLLDTYGELSFNRKLSLIYSLVDKFVKDVKSLLNKRWGSQYLLLIISDHGIKNIVGTRFGEHSSYAFYSLNIPIPLKNVRITDFYPLIRNLSV